jgi:AraC-like DNA-binding protein
MRLRARDEREIAGAQLRYVQLGSVNLVHYRAVGVHTAERTRAHILKDAARYFFLCIPLGARYMFSYRGHVGEVPRESFVLLSSDTPFVTEQSGLTPDAEFAAAVVRLPATPLRHRIPTIDDLCGHFIPMAPGLSGAIRSAVDWTMNMGSTLDGQSARSIGAGLFGMICDYAEQISSSRTYAQHSRSSLERTLERAKAYIEENLSNASLTAADVARHCRISTRYLQTAFAAHCESASHYIRERRLQQCRQALQDESLAHRSVIEIAASWGFTDPCHFSRAYKARFGIAPSLDRRRPAKAG